MVTQSTPFSALLQQLISTTTIDTSSKGKRKASTAASRFFISDTPVVSSDDKETADAFCKLVEQQSDGIGTKTLTRLSATRILT
ncbi:unnamed protein product [Absidia cylindrospora]